MSSGNPLESEAFIRGLQATLAKELAAAAEPEIQAALKRVEVAMRARVNEAALSLVGYSYNMERDARSLTIRVNLDALKEKS
jgi:hypothetical protein